MHYTPSKHTSEDDVALIKAHRYLIDDLPQQEQAWRAHDAHEAHEATMPRETRAFDARREELEACWAESPPGQLMALKHPEGFELCDKHGEPLCMVCRENLHGHPAASGNWSKTRDEFILKHFTVKWRLQDSAAGMHLAQVLNSISFFWQV